MSRDFVKKIIVGLDIGSSKVAAIVAESLPEEDQFEVIGYGCVPSNGIRRGVVVNIDHTVESIQNALHEAELFASCNIREVFTGIGGAHISSFNSSGVAAVADRKEVCEADIERVRTTAQTVHTPAEHDILHVITQHYTLDNQEGIIQPKGMAGTRLEVQVHIVTGSHSAVQNIIKCVRRCGLEVSELILQPLADSQVCLTPEEKELGVCLIDIGSGTTGMAIYDGGTVRYTSIMEMGGQQLTSDIASMLRVPTNVAEDIKLQYGAAFCELVDGEETFEIPGLSERGPRIMKRGELADIIQKGVEEILIEVNNHLIQSGYRDKIKSIVITGGSALLPGIVELAEACFRTPTRIGRPIYHGALSDLVTDPKFSTAMGLVREARLQLNIQDSGRVKQGIFGYLKNLFQSLF
ncbi:cell division protein FtsA [Brackiella oedipodis]|uniref:cell division protein FtsA n=1 Tax=Brackiella oedipodis TaxID=124225 RepID=UPI00048A4E04|nr:cell division protein FtsA [Brackiella oedipodis]